ncbi:MAG: CapA family protein [Cyanobacteria bacterium P01_A01_bin.114]
MASAANSHTATPHPKTAPADLAQIQQLAATGHYRAIAFWLNHALIPQGVYAHVQADDRPGCLRILLEFKRQPKKEALMRLLCSRIWKLNSEIIEGIHVVARFIGQSRYQWQRRVRVLSPAFRQKHQIKAPRPLNQPPDRKPPPIDINALAIRRRDARRHRLIFKSRTVIDQQFKLLRAVVVTGSATAAFILGCITELMLSGYGPSLPQFGVAPREASREASRATSSAKQTETAPATEISNEAVFAHRYPDQRTVAAPLEAVAVSAHTQVINPRDPNITLLFGGEVTLGDLNIKSPETADQLFSDLTAYPQADVAMVNLGSPLATAGTSLQEEYHRRTHRDAVTALQEGGVDIVGLTSDRALHYGEQGLVETLATLDQAGIYRIGAGRNHLEARRPEILEVKGQRIAYLGYTPNGATPAKADKAGINVQDKAAILEDITALRNDVDWIVVNYRWLGELDKIPSSQQVKLARSAIDAGADLVVGYHPHQLQGAELYKERPIVYSLGDFIFADAPLDNRDTAALKVSLRSGQMKVEFLPVSVRDAQPRAATGEQGVTILRQLREASEPLESPLIFPAILEAKPHPKAPKPANSQPMQQVAPAIPATPAAPAPLNAPLNAPRPGAGLQQGEPQLAPTAAPTEAAPAAVPTETAPAEVAPSEAAPVENLAPKPASAPKPLPETAPSNPESIDAESLRELPWAPFPADPEKRQQPSPSFPQDSPSRFDNFTDEDFINPDSEQLLQPSESSEPLSPPLDQAPAEQAPLNQYPSPLDQAPLDHWGPKPSSSDPSPSSVDSSVEEIPSFESTPERSTQSNRSTIDKTTVPTPAQIPAAEGAIKPYREPLVGPLTQRLIQQSPQKASILPVNVSQLSSPELGLPAALGPDLPEPDLPEPDLLETDPLDLDLIELEPPATPEPSPGSSEPPQL